MATLHAQEGSPPVVFFMSLATREADAGIVAALLEGMREQGLIERRDFTFVWRQAGGNFKLAESMIAEQMAQRPVAVFVAPGPAAARLILRHSAKVPIVSAGLHPRGGQTDLFDSLARPGGRVTGVSNFGEELAGKRVQLLREARPNLRKVGVLHNTSEPAFQRWGEETEVVARSQGLAALRVGLASPSVAAMLHGLRQAHAQGVEAVIVVRDFLTAALHRHVSAICLERGLPIMAEERIYPEAGALMSYGASEREQFRGVATYVHRLLKGASPAGLPIEQVARFELVLNLKTARALGLKPAQSLLLAADEVIE